MTQVDLAARVLELVREVAGGQVQAEASVQRTSLALTRFANSFIHQNVADDTTGVRLRLHLDGRTAAGSSTVVSADGLRALVERTVAAARLCPPDPGWPGLTPPTPAPPAAAFDERTADADPAARADLVRAFVAAAEGLETAGYCRTLHWAGAFANSAGHSVTGRTSEAAMDGIVRVDGSDGVARRASVGIADLDGTVLGGRAAAKARAGADPVELPPGRYEVVLEPDAVADVLSNLAMWGFNGKAYAERRSFAELGAQQFDGAVTLVDDPFAPGTPGVAFDDDGTPKNRLPLVQAGVTTAVAHDRRTAAQAGGDTVSTGHALPGGGQWGAIPLNVALAAAPGAGTPTEVAGPAADSTVAELVAGMGRGLLVTDLWYTRVLDPKSLVVTGLTRNGVWLVEGGEVTRPVRNFRFTQSYPQALGPQAVKAIGGHATLLPHSWGTAWWSAPALHLASWNFTGGASG